MLLAVLSTVMSLNIRTDRSAEADSAVVCPEYDQGHKAFKTKTIHANKEASVEISGLKVKWFSSRR